MKTLLKEFKEFAVKGNVVDMAVGVIVGGAFGKIVTSLVNDVIMPLVGVLTGGIDFSNLFLPLDGIPTPRSPKRRPRVRRCSSTARSSRRCSIF